MSEAPRASRAAMVRLAAVWVVLPLFFLITGGDPRWWDAWIWCASMGVPMLFFVAYILRADPGFLERRARLREKEAAQRRVLALGNPLLLAAFGIPGLDHRFGWSAPPPWLVAVAHVAVLVGYLLVLRVFVENRWAGRTVETFEGQQVIDSGPYAWVRHPMYTGSLVLFLATPLSLGSWWGTLPVIAFVPVMMYRAVHEETLLVRDLPGYADYCARVRYRLLPFVW